MAKSSKGAEWERKLCKIFSKWINGTEKPYVFWRGRGSGAMFSMDNSLGEAFSGDIYCVREEGKFLTEIFSIEAKNGYPKASLDLHLKDNKNNIIEDFWFQACKDAEESNKYPMLIFKKKGMSNPWIGFCNELYLLIKKEMKNCKFIHLNFGDSRKELYLHNLKDFLINIKPDDLKRLLN